MRKQISITGALIILTLLSGVAYGQKFDTLWTQTYWNGYFDSVNCVQQTADGGYILVGVTRAEGQIDSDLDLIKTDGNGNEVWSKVLGDTANECGFHVLQSIDGGYLISASSDAPLTGYGKLWIVKTDENGDTVWSYIHAPLEIQHNGFPLYAIQTHDSGFAITGIININYDNKAFLLRLNKNGGFLDMDTISDYSYQDGVFITEMPDNGFIVAGNFRDPYSTDYDFWVFRTNSAGTVMWDSIYAITEYTDLMYGACRDENGIVMVGVARGESWAHKIDFDGHTIWSKSISKNFTNERVTNICPTDDGGFMVGGWIWVVGHRRDFCFTKLDPELDTLWTFTVGGTEDDNGQWLVPTSDGGFVMTGSSTSFVNGECNYLVKARSYFCGDANGDASIDVGDAIYIVSYIFRHGPAPVLGYCHADANGDDVTDVGDALHLINYIFRSGPPPLETCCE